VPAISFLRGVTASLLAHFLVSASLNLAAKEFLDFKGVDIKTLIENKSD
jgi:hypothetical protein